ncbi:helix-turn-helix domain-containing protein [Streptosporangium minutum]|uniref:helix-turn-helix domain-containing protein n=1 Tax=Streptosporangium minutum TaxID=569862 RepID=UPI000D525BAE|nr:helix-turn-helix domain-containing protein [Streptosporangium minutum]
MVAKQRLTELKRKGPRVRQTLRAGETKDEASSMARIAGQSPETYFGELPETSIWSDRISHNGIRVLAVLYGRWTKKFWPVLTNEEIAKLSSLSVATIGRAVSELKKLGLIKVTRTKDGNKYELIKVEFEDDSYRGRNVVSREAHAKIFLSMTASPISSGALRLWLMLDRIGRTHEWAWSSQSALAKYMGVQQRQIRVYLNELKEAGLLESRRPDPLGKNEYRLIRTPVMVKVAEEHDEKQAILSATARVARKWLTAVLGDAAREWVNDNDEIYQSIWRDIRVAVACLGEEATVKIVDDTLATYGTDYLADFIVKILDEWVDEDDEEEPKDDDEGHEADFPDADQVPGVIDCSDPTNAANRLAMYRERMAS